MEKRYHNLLLVIFLLIILFIQCDIALGNIVPVDSDYGGFPAPADYEANHTAIPVFFKQESINVTFDSSKAYVNAFYTLKSNKSTAIDVGIALPIFRKRGSSYKAFVQHDHDPPEFQLRIVIVRRPFQ